MFRIEETGLGNSERFSVKSVSVIVNWHWASTSASELQPVRLLLIVTAVFGLKIASQTGLTAQNERDGLSSMITPIRSDVSKFVKEDIELRDSFSIIDRYSSQYTKLSIPSNVSNTSLSRIPIQP